MNLKIHLCEEVEPMEFACLCGQPLDNKTLEVSRPVFLLLCDHLGSDHLCMDCLRAMKRKGGIGVHRAWNNARQYKAFPRLC